MPFLDEIEAAIPGLRAFARALVRDREAADDLVQDTLEAAISRQGQWRGEGALRGWLCRILMNRFRDEMKQSESPTLLNYGSLDLGLFNICNITPSTRYFCTLNLRSEEMLEQIDGYLLSGSVEYIVSFDDSLATKFDRYELVDSGYSVINEGRTDVYLYQLKSAISAN